jgi:hypothetical protein
LDDVFGGLAGDPLSKVEYGYKEVKSAKDWFIRANIPVYLPFRIDNPTMPCISIMQESSSEMHDRASLADEGGTALIEDIEPRRATTQPQYVVPPFSPAGYNPQTGDITLPEGVTTECMAEGQFLVSARTGKAYAIKSILGTQDFTIAPNVVDDFEGAYILPPTTLWNLHREFAFMAESFEVGCHAASDPVITMWLRAVVMYIMLRYREAYLEARGFEVSSLVAGPVAPNPNFTAEKIYSASVKLQGQVEASWVKFIAPKLDAVTGEIVIADGPKTPSAYENYVKNQGWEMEGDVTGKKKKRRKKNVAGVVNPKIEEQAARDGELDVGLLGEDDT